MTTVSMSRVAGLLTFFLCASLCTPAAQAGEGDRLSLSLGYYDILDDQDAVDFRGEYRFGHSLVGNIKPFAGVEFTSDGAVYALGGLYLDWMINEKWIITPSFGVGLYEDGDGKDLGHTVEFRSQIEAAYEMEDLSRVGLGFSHISNANLGDYNPGTEILSLYYHIPVEGLF